MIIIIGGFNKLNRQFKYSNGCQRLNAEKSAKIEDCLLELLKETKEMKQQLIKYNYHVKMESGDISSMFPLENDEQLNNFMKQDQEWDKRRKESYNLLYFIYIYIYIYIYMLEGIILYIKYNHCRHSTNSCLMLLLRTRNYFQQTSSIHSSLVTSYQPINGQPTAGTNTYITFFY